MDRPRERVVRIVSEGSANDTHVFLEGGGVLNNVYRLVAEVEVGHVTQVEVYVHMAEIDVKAHVRTVYMKCPICDHEQEHRCD